jgi:hypothetical protein
MCSEIELCVPVTGDIFKKDKGIVQYRTEGSRRCFYIRGPLVAQSRGDLYASVTLVTRCVMPVCARGEGGGLLFLPDTCKGHAVA